MAKKTGTRGYHSVESPRKFEQLFVFALQTSNNKV